MRKKIQDIIRGKVETPAPVIVLPEKDLQIAVIEHDVCQGSFSFYSGTGNPVRGLVTCPDDNLICMTPKFDGKRVQVLFEYHGKNMEEGDEKDGYFVITSNAGEYIYPYHVRTTRNYAHTSIGWIKSLDDFTNLAKLNWQEALNLFRSAKFTQIFRKGEEKEKDLYYAITSRGINSACMEEFLVGCGCKERVSFSVREDKQTFVINREPIRESIRIEKNEWGYLPITVSTDAPFVKIAPDAVPESGFSSKYMEVAYTILPNLMHGGRNFARIVIEDITKRAEMEIVVVSDQFRIKKREESIISLQAHLAEEYLAYLDGRMSLIEWKDSSLRQISSAIRRFPENNWLPLYEAYVYLSTGDQSRGGRILEAFSEKVNLKRTPVEGFYQYLTTFRNPDPEYHKEVIYYIRELFKRHSGHQVLAWILLSADEALLRNDERRYHFLRQFMAENSANPILYREGAQIILKNPEYLRAGGKFEQRMVRWMQKKKIRLPQIPERFWAQLSEGSVFRAHTFRIMTDYYAENPSDEMLKAICSYLIKTNSYRSEYAYWFRSGIDKDSKVAGLYEAFLRTWNRQDEIPAKVRKYFMLQRDLPWKWRAKLYAYVLDAGEQIGDDMAAYEELILEFAKDCIRKRYMNKDLIRIYRFLKESIPQEEWDKISNHNDRTVCFTVSNDKIRHICISDGGQREMFTVALHDGTAFVRLPEKIPVILLSDHLGGLYVPNDLMQMTPLVAQTHIPLLTKEETDKDALTRMKPIREDEISARLQAFDDTLARMDAMIKMGKRLGLVTISHEEQLLARMLFTGIFTDSHETLFEDVVKSHENPMLCDAYVCHFAKAFLMEREQIPQTAVYYILYAMQNERPLNDDCLVALLKYQYTTLAERPLLPRTAEKMLRNLFLKGWQFGFYSQLPESIKRSYLLTGILFIQYAGEAGEVLELKTVMSDPHDPSCQVERAYRLPEVLSGIYCVGIPVLPGYRLHYTITTPDGTVREDRTLRIDPDFMHGGEESLYGETAKIFSGRNIDETQLMRTARLTDLTEAAFQMLEE